MQIDFSPTRNHSERTESSSSTALSQGSYGPPPQPVVGLDQNNKKVYGIYEESPPITTGKRGRHLSGFPTWRFFKFVTKPLQSNLRKNWGVMHPHQLCDSDETRSLPERTDNKATSPQRRSKDSGGTKPKRFSRSRSNMFFAKGLNGLIDSPTISLPSPKFSPHLSSSPAPLELRLELVTAPGSTRDDTPMADTKSDGGSLPQETSHIPSVMFSEEDNLPGRCVIAESALLHAGRNHVALRDVLIKSGYEGSYLIQAGFNQDMLGLNQGFLQEIHLFLEFEVHPTCAENIARVLNPFPVTTYTPDTTYHYPSPEAEEESWDMWVQHGVFCQEIRDQKTVETLALSDAGSHLAYSTSSSSNGSASGHSGNFGGRSSDSGTRRDNLGGGDGNTNGGGREDSSREGSGGSDEGDQDGADDQVFLRVEDLSVCGHTTRQISIPFSSTITLSAGGTRQPSTRYNTNASIEIKIEDNPDSQSPPPGLIWGSPWLEAKFTSLDAEMHVTSEGKPSYHLSLAQIRIMASGCDVSRLAYSPKIIRFDDGDLISIMQRSRAVGGRATLGAAPTVRLDGTIGQTTGEERPQNRWGVTSHRLPSDTNDAGEPRASIMWKYTHNDKHYHPETQNDFEPKPSVTFGISRTSPRLPKIEVEVVMDYSGSPPSQTFREWLADTARPKSKKELPGYTNFLHQVSVEAELEHVKERIECVIGLNAEDRCEVSEINTERKRMYMHLESHAGPSDCQVLLKKALHGRIHLTQEQKEEHRSSSLPWPLQTSFITQGMLGVGLLTPEPSPTSSVMVNDISVNSD